LPYSLAGEQAGFSDFDASNMCRGRIYVNGVVATGWRDLAGVRAALKGTAGIVGAGCVEMVMQLLQVALLLLWHRTPDEPPVRIAPLE